MSVQITDPIGALVVVAVVLLIAWLIAYSAARTATDDLRTVRLTVSVSTVADGSEIIVAVANRGMKPAYDVTLVPSSATAAAALAVVGDVPPGGSVAALVDRAALAGPADELPPYIRVEWRIEGPGGPKRWAHLALVRSADSTGA